jgi:hypothetical protein
MNLTVNCKKHNITPAYKSGKRIRCKACNVEAVTKKRREIKLKAIEYKGGKCEHCGYNKCPSVFDFHHLDPNKKDFAISSNGHSRSWDRVKKELDKCILLCSNCHRELHADFYSPLTQK